MENVSKQKIFHDKLPRNCYPLLPSFVLLTDIQYVQIYFEQDVARVVCSFRGNKKISFN